MDLLITYVPISEKFEIIKTFNFVANKELSKDDENKFLLLLTSFKFNESDQLCTSLKLLINTFNIKVSLIDLHFKYAINGKGYNDIFNKCLNK